MNPDRLLFALVTVRAHLRALFDTDPQAAERFAGVFALVDKAINEATEEADQ
jgi:hypothetical protein